jgi:hypothetical protein
VAAVTSLPVGIALAIPWPAAAFQVTLDALSICHW